ncbi:hypothetical protein SteCoe_11320 [Stentor coeruleus]|uniref:Uncharacterized protein n=1 Tax=Stentor coeruleus TaxID=5963 RepID=A0A1R2CDM5_9CILI|nr:hypothetical protein SteCoe_11320 [Stentor coeruleus]
MKSGYKERTKSVISTPSTPYKYDNQGNIVSSYHGLEKMPLTPMKYRELRSRHSENPCSRQKSPKSYSKFQLSKCFKSKLLLNMSKREVYVLRDGCTVSDKTRLPGFYYTYELINSNDRLIHFQEMKEFFLHCQKYFKTSAEFKFLFSCGGKILRCLHEIDALSKIVIVGHTPEYRGIVEQERPQTTKRDSRSPCYKTVSSDKTADPQILTNIESQFEVKSQKLPTRIRQFITPTRPYTTQTQTRLYKHIPSYNINDIKTKLGNVSQQIDSTFPTLCSQGIKKLKKKYNFTESELHSLYGKFKLLVLLSCGVDSNHDISLGINKKTFVDYYAKSL